MRIIDRKICPICGESLKQEIVIDTHDAVFVSCRSCGDYGMTAEFCEDQIESGKMRAKTEAFLSRHANDIEKPFLVNQTGCVIKGYTCYPAWRIR